MKIALIVFAICVISTCYQFPNITTSQYYIPIVDFIGAKQTIVYITENNTNNILINSIISHLHNDQAVVLFSGESYKIAKKGVVYKDPNIIIFLDRLSQDYLWTLKKRVTRYWSHVYVIITTRNSSQTCENGTLSKSLFENAQFFMNAVWQMSRVVRVTVSFPYTCPHHYIIYSGKKPSHTDVYNRTIKIVEATNKNELKAVLRANTKTRELTKGYPLKANIFFRFPTSITDCDGIVDYARINYYNYTNGYCGMDGLVMHEFIKYFKFNVTLPSDKRCDEYGFVVPKTGQVSGILGCIVRGEVDISFNSRFMVEYTTIFYHYLHYISVDTLAVVLQRPEIIPLWQYAYNSYGPITAFILSILILALGIVTWSSTWITREISKQKPKKVYVYIVNALVCTLFGFPIERGSERFRVLRATSLVCSVILLALYQGNVSKQFTTCTRQKELKTLHQLYHSKYVLYTSPSIKELLMTYANPNDKDQVEYLNRTKIKDDGYSTECVFNYPMAATLVRGEDVLIEVLINFTDVQGFPLIYKIDESFQTYYLSYIARPGFIFVEDTLRFLLRLLEAGLPNRYYVWTRESLKLGDAYGKTKSEARPINKTKLEHLRVAFCVLGFGYLLSACSFFAERYKGIKRLHERTLS